jgi:transposase-like protein
MRVYSHDFRVQVVRRILNGETVSALSKELDIHPKVLYEWKRRVNEGGESNLRKRGRPRNNEVRDGTGSIPRHAAELERTIASQRLVIEFLESCLAASREMAPREKDAWSDCIFRSIEVMMQEQSGLSVGRMCKLARVPRSGYYRYLRRRDRSLR